MAVPDLGFIELMRWAWRQLTSMRTALILLLLLALAAVPGSVIPQSDVDAMRANNWKADHPDLTPIYEKLGLFSVYDSVWFSAIYLLLMVSLVGCILPRLRVYWRGFRAAPPKAPRNLTRLPENASYTTDEPVEEVLARAEQVLRKRRFRVITDGDAISAERGYLREAGNLVFHASLLVVLAGVAMGSLMGYQGGVIVGKGASFSNNLTQYDDFKAGRMVGVDNLDPFTFTVDDFEVEWIDDPTNPRYGMARKFVAPLTYRDGSDGEEKTYDLRVNHPLKIGSTDVFLIGHGYSPVITIRDAEGNIATSGPTPFLPEDQATFTSFGVVKAPGAEPQQIGLEGLLYPTYSGDPNNLGSVFGALGNPLISMQAYVGDLGLAAGSQSVYVLNKTNMKLLGGTTKDLFRVDLCPAKIDGKENARCENSTVQLPDGAGSVTFEDITPWVRVQISQTPGKMVALGGMIAALLGLLGSLFIRPRRMWVRVRETDGSTVVEVAALDRSSGGEVGEEIVEVVAALKGETVKEEL